MDPLLKAIKYVEERETRERIEEYANWGIDVDENELDDMEDY